MGPFFRDDGMTAVRQGFGLFNLLLQYHDPGGYGREGGREGTLGHIYACGHWGLENVKDSDGRRWSVGLTYLLTYTHTLPTPPELAGHLHQEGFPPELYATPYFLTLFAHNLELYLVHRLWVRALV